MLSEPASGRRTWLQSMRSGNSAMGFALIPLRIKVVIVAMRVCFEVFCVGTVCAFAQVSVCEWNLSAEFSGLFSLSCQRFS